MSTGLPDPTEVLLHPYPLSFPFPTFRYLCHSWWTCWSDPGRHYTWRQRSDSVLAPGEALSVVTPRIRNKLDVAITSEPRWNQPVPDWHGVPCAIGRLRLWLPDEKTLVLQSYSLLALLPNQDPPDALPYVYLGVQFLLEYRITVTLDCSQAPGRGVLVIP